MFVNNIINKRITRYNFKMDVVPLFLTEETAIAFARKALAIEGYDAERWELIPQSGLTADPNGHIDKQISRNLLNPNRISMMVVNKKEKRGRCINVELKGDQVFCELIIPK